MRPTQFFSETDSHMLTPKLCPVMIVKELARYSILILHTLEKIFKSQVSLTVSGQLLVKRMREGDIYTLVQLRAEDSHTSRHLSELRMIEPNFALLI